jgi:hypothetical protein
VGIPNPLFFNKAYGFNFSPIKREIIIASKEVARFHVGGQGKAFKASKI